MASTGDWQAEFRALFERGVSAYDGDGARTPSECLGEEDREFLASLGCSAQMIYDFVEDWCWAKEPSLDEVLGVVALRRQHFIEVQGGQARNVVRAAGDFPPGTAALEGISWLPRLLAKARAALVGELPPQLMYGCGGDRPFLRTYGVGLAEFLRCVRDAGTDDRAVVQFLKTKARIG